MAYNIYSNVANINSVKVGQIYISNPSAQLGYIDKDKTKLHSSGSFSTRPVLIVREPEPWDRYTTVSVCCSTTKEVPSISFAAADNVYNFKLHDIRTICVSSLLRLVGALSPSAIAMCQAVMSSFYGVNEHNVQSRLDELRKFMYGIGETHINDVRNVYEALYSKYSYCVDRSYAPDWRLTNKTMDNYNQIQCFSYHSSINESLPPKITAAEAGLVPDNLVDGTTTDAKSEPLVRAKTAIKKGIQRRHKDTCLKFVSSPNTRSWRPISPTTKPIDQHVAESLYLSGYVTCDSMAQKFGVSRYKFDKQAKANLAARTGNIAEATWSVDSETYSQFMTWWKNNDLEDTGYFKRSDVEAMFPLIRDSLVPYPLTEPKVPCTLRTQFYVEKLTWPEIIEVVPLMCTTKIAELTGAHLATAKELKDYCMKCREVHLRMMDHILDDQIAKIRLYITPNNMAKMPAWLRADFMAIPIEKLREYCQSLPGWSGYDFDEIYAHTVKAFLAKM